jgi:hypothetical protein
MKKVLDSYGNEYCRRYPFIPPKLFLLLPTSGFAIAIWSRELLRFFGVAPLGSAKLEGKQRAIEGKQRATMQVKPGLDIALKEFPKMSKPYWD